jgi:hypothetical protein
MSIEQLTRLLYTTPVNPKGQVLTFDEAEYLARGIAERDGSEVWEDANATLGLDDLLAARGVQHA